MSKSHGIYYVLFHLILRSNRLLLQTENSLPVIQSGIDYTMSNHSQGEITFGGKNLHTLSTHQRNPYQEVRAQRPSQLRPYKSLWYYLPLLTSRIAPLLKVIALVSESLSPFDEDNIIPAFGFGDLNTKDHSVFPLTPEV